MEKNFMKAILMGLFFMNVSSVSLGDTKNSIRFIVKNESGQLLNVNCGNFSYPNNPHEFGDNSYTIEPEGFVWNPRRLKYTCSISLPILGRENILTFYPSEFNHSLNRSEVVITVHHVDKNANCAPAVKSVISHQALVTYSLAVDGRWVENHNRYCFYSMNCPVCGHISN